MQSRDQSSNGQRNIAEPKTNLVTSSRRRRKPAVEVSDTRLGSRMQSIDGNESQLGMEAPEMTSALRDYELAQDKRDSISRKLSCGSTHVSVRDLSNWEVSLSELKKALVQRWPILERHPTFSAVDSHR